uniref:Uncharacterized protein n=1 Tax=Equus asinus TaxID=9793 RepID=A0A9L0KBF5_EQUAS
MKKSEENTKTKNKPLSPIKLTPTSVLDYFGTGSVQRSDKKMVSSKRKEPSQNTDDSRLNDEAIAKQLQLDEDAELERQLHEDEEFARTLAMLDEEPKTKKVAFEWAVCILNIQYRSVFPFIPVYSRLWRCNHE